MGDGFQAVVFNAGSPNNAAKLRQRLQQTLAAEGIVASVASDCTLGNPERSFAPGPNYRSATTEEDHLDFKLRVNGVEFSDGRQVEIAPDIYHAYCRSCDYGGEVDDRFFEAVSTWYSGNDSAEVACPVCGSRQPLVQWRIEPPWGFGDVVVTFWNWAPLNRAFLNQLSEQAEHLFVLVSGKI
jgi:hypothetical protein